MGSVIVIPARGGSKNIPRKNLQLIKNRPLISYAIEIAFKVKSVEKVIVSTEDNEIAEISKSYGADVFNRPLELADDHVNILPVNQHVLKRLEKDKYYPERFISLQPTAPLLEPKNIDKAIKFHHDSGCDSVCSVAMVKHNHPYWVKSVNPVTKELSDFTNVKGDTYLQKQDLPECYSYTGGFYIRKRDVLERGKGKGLGDDIRGYIISDVEALDIDYPLDLEYFRFLMERIS